MTHHLTSKRKHLRQLLSFAIFFAVVSYPVKHIIEVNVANHLSTWQAVAYLMITIAGMLLGFSLQERLQRFADEFSRALLQNFSEERRIAYLRHTAIIILFLSLLTSLLWTNAALNQFVDLHRGLYVEANLLVYLMGFVIALAWILLLGRFALYGLLFSSTLTFMMIANLLARHSL